MTIIATRYPAALSLWRNGHGCDTVPNDGRLTMIAPEWDTLESWHAEMRHEHATTDWHEILRPISPHLLLLLWRMAGRALREHRRRAYLHRPTPLLEGENTDA